MRRLLLLLSALLTVSAGSGAQATGTTVTPKPRGAGMEVRQYTLQVLSVSEGVSLLIPFVPFEDGGGVWRSSGSVISVVGNKRTLAVVDSVLKSYDHAPATLVLRFMLIAATDSAVSDPRIGEVDVELRRLLKFNGYRRLAEATSVVSEGANFTSTMSAADSGEFTLDGGVKSVRDGRVALVMQMQRGTSGTMMGLPTSASSRQLLSTTLTVPIGQTIVLGTAAGEKGVEALILTVRPELAAGQAAVPPAGPAIAPASAMKTVGNPWRSDTGTFAFRARYGSATFDGIFHAFGDSVTVESEYGHCTPIAHRGMPDGRGGSYRCTGMPMLDDFTISFGTRDREKASWSGSVTKLQASGKECVLYTTDKQGQSVCARWQPKMVETRVTVGDRILFLPTRP